MQPTAISPVAREAWGLLVTLVFSQRESVVETAGEFGLTPGHAMALMQLDPENPAPMRQLRDQLHCDPSYLTGVVDRLERLGFVERRPSTTDRRVKELVLTERGRDVQRELHRLWIAPPPGLDALTERDQKALLRIAQQLLAGVDLSGLPLPMRPHR